MRRITCRGLPRNAASGTIRRPCLYQAHQSLTGSRAAYEGWLASSLIFSSILASRPAKPSFFTISW
jgi:hypothetical protein